MRGEYYLGYLKQKGNEPDRKVTGNEPPEKDYQRRVDKNWKNIKLVTIDRSNWRAMTMSNDVGVYVDRLLD